MTTADRPIDELMADGVMTSPSSPCFSTTVPSNGAKRSSLRIVASVSWMLACVSLIAASSGGDPGVGHVAARRRPSRYSSIETVLLR